MTEHMDLMLAGMLVVACAIGIWFDLRENRLPNRLTVTFLVAALAVRAVGGMELLQSGVLAATAGFVLALPFYLLGGLGAGDVKFLAAVGALIGLPNLPVALLVTALVGGVMALVTLVRNRAVRKSLSNLHAILLTFGPKSFTGWKGEDSEALLTVDSPHALTVPYGVAIAVGALTGWFLG